MTKGIKSVNADSALPLLSYTDIDLINEISSEVLTNLSLYDLLQQSIEKIVERYNLLGGILFLVEGDDIYAKTLAGDRAAGKFLQLIGQPISNLKIHMLENTENLVVKAVQSKTVQFSYSLEDFTKGVLSRQISKVAAVITNTKACLAIPIIHRQKVVGAMFFSKSSRKDFSKVLLLLQLLSNNIGIGIINARLYEQLQEQNSQLQAAFDTVSELRRQERDMMDVLGHELKTPITTVLAMLGMIEKHKQLNKLSEDKLDSYLKLALESTRKEAALIETLLLATKVDAQTVKISPQKVDLISLIENSIAGHSQISRKKRLEVIFERPQAEVTIFTDPVRLQEVFDNLLSNAIKYTPAGKVKVSLVKMRRQIKVSVEDNGIGISPTDVKNLSKKFFRAKDSLAEAEKRGFTVPSGTGLGLYVVKGLLKEMGGKLKVQSELGKGSTFTFELPTNIVK